MAVTEVSPPVGDKGLKKDALGFVSSVVAFPSDNLIQVAIGSVRSRWAGIDRSSVPVRLRSG